MNRHSLFFDDYCAQFGNRAVASFLSREAGRPISHEGVRKWRLYGIPVPWIAIVAHATNIAPNDLRPDLATLFNGEFDQGRAA